MKISLTNAVGDFFETEEKWMTLLLLTVCQLIPIVGPMVIMGYLFRRFALKRSGSIAPDFKFDYFGDYLQIGLWPFLAYFVLSLIAIPLIIAAEIPMIWTMMKLEDEPSSIGPPLPSMALTYGLIFIISLTLITVAAPVILRSGLMKGFKEGFSKCFIFGFIKKVGLSLLGWLFLFGILSYVATIIGVFAFIVGAFFVSTIAMYAMFHLLFQHYDLYLERGGEKIEIHPEVLKSATVAPSLPPTATHPE